MVANEAATQTGLPPNVEACEPGFQSMISARATVAPKGMPLAMPFARVMMSGSRVEVLGREHSSGAAHSGLHFVENEQNLVLCCESLQFVDEFSRRDNVSAFTLDRFEKNGSDLFGRNHLPHDRIFQIADTLDGATIRRSSERATITVRIGRMMHAWYKWKESFLLDMLAAGQRQRSECASVE